MYGSSLKIDSGKYANDSEYLRELIGLDQKHKKKIAVLRSALDQGEKSGISKRSMDDILSDAKNAQFKCIASLLKRVLI